jgi:hypothetical protein
LLPLYVNLVGHERIDDNGEALSPAARESESPLLPVNDPGRSWAAVPRHWNLDGSDHSMVIPASESTHTPEADLGRQRKNQGVRQKNIRAIKVLGDIPNVPSHLGALVAKQAALLRSLYTRDTRDPQDLFSRQREHVQRSLRILVDPESPPAHEPLTRHTARVALRGPIS